MPIKIMGEIVFVSNSNKIEALLLVLMMHYEILHSKLKNFCDDKWFNQSILVSILFDLAQVDDIKVQEVETSKHGA